MDELVKNCASLEGEAILHIGLAKTGTTAIQNALWKSRESLRDLGLHVIEKGRHGSGHHCVAWALRNDAKAEVLCPDFDLTLLQEEINADFSKKVILSSEGFSDFAFKVKTLNALRDLLSRRHTRVVVYVREQLDLINSFYCELIKSFDTSESFEDFAQRLLAEKRYDYSNWLSPFRNIFEEITVGIHSKSHLKNGDVVADFFGLIGADSVEPPRLDGARTNPSISTREVSLCRAIRRELEERAALPPKITTRQWLQFKRVLRGAVSDELTLKDEPYWGASDALEAAINQQFSEANKAFSDAFLDGSDWTHDVRNLRSQIRNDQGTTKDVHALACEIISRSMSSLDLFNS